MMRRLSLLAVVGAFVVIVLIVSEPVLTTASSFRFLIAALFVAAILVAVISATGRGRA